MDKLSYAIGMNIANSLKSSGISNLNIEDFSNAINDIYGGKNPALSPDEAKKVINDYFERLEKELPEKNLKEGKAFLEENKKRDGVQTLPSGLQYEILRKGNGKKPSASDRVECHYHGTLIDGTVFDSSVQRGTPAVFGVNQVIKGWVEALQLMEEGAKWRLFIPSELAYGENAPGGAIGPNATLIFDVELLKVL
ncbi:MAG: FKBP-type peptidyl-prolyl cis-trans isomerase [Bacteroidetes bacterium]|uniref:Peptidyl-prolyl cis-trans isomerase n=1 Tax=Candidatus Caccoplasma merdipullorum TaxID=2840718 RepID=A0A9D9H881_9BACT|nr:FKBP-type peptidyl-prolyl cis-trans isomerase [Candidatus Caccoplasma merdipullorum]